MTFTVSELDPRLPFGSVVSGLAIEDLVDDSVQARLRRLWVERGLIVFEHLDLDEDGHVALSSVFGEAEIHPLRDPAKPGRPELSDIRCDDVFGDYYQFAGGEIRGAWLPWHFDLVYVDRINHGGILRAIELPASGGETAFADGIASYEALPISLKDRIADLRVVYSFDIDASHQRVGATDGLRLVRMDPRSRKIMERPGGHPEVLHPMVFEQAETGRKVLNVSPWFALRVADLPREEGDALLEEVIGYAADWERAYVHRWSLDSAVLWDNWRLMHTALGVPDGVHRRMQRTTIAGDYGHGQLLDERSAIGDDLRINV